MSFIPRRYLAPGLIVVLLLLITSYVISPPSSFKEEGIFSVEEGDSTRSVAKRLKEEGYIHSYYLFGALVKTINQGSLIAGDYYFEDKDSLPTIVRRFGNGAYNLKPVTVTLPEGFTSRQMAETFELSLPFFDAREFLESTSTREGYLFPDTYEFFLTTRGDEVAAKLRATFEEKTETLKKEAREKGMDWEEILVMASILEKEAHDTETRRMIADILWRRIDEGMALQVDAPFLYLLGKESSELTLTDLKMDSPFNTYVNRGLPPSPIVNPGLDSIKAALNPIPNEYVYYLADREGTTYYSKTLEEHAKKKAQFLN